MDPGILQPMIGWAIQQTPVVVVCLAWVFIQHREKTQLRKDLSDLQNQLLNVSNKTNEHLGSASTMLQTMHNTLQILASKGE